MAIRLEAAVTAKCRPEHVWQKFSKIEEWPWWNKVIGQARWIEGQPWQKGSRFYMELVRPKTFKVQPVILECTPPIKVGWAGKAMGIIAEHWFSFEPQSDGSTLIRTWEDFSGLGTLFVGNGMKQKIVKMYEDWLNALMFEAERLAREEYARS
jgi:hypothetical protein